MVAEDADHLESLGRKCAIENEHGIKSRIVERDELLEIAPYLSDRLYGAAFCEQEGKVNPLKANRAIEKAGPRGRRRAGARVGLRRHHAGGRALRAQDGERPRSMPTRVVLAAGAGSGLSPRKLGVALPTSAEPLHMNITDRRNPS